jgi:hypothetical protein
MGDWLRHGGEEENHCPYRISKDMNSFIHNCFETLCEQHGTGDTYLLLYVKVMVISVKTQLYKLQVFLFYH